MARSNLFARVAALEAAKGSLLPAGDPLLLSEDQLWDVIRRECAKTGTPVPDLAVASEAEIDEFLIAIAMPAEQQERGS